MNASTTARALGSVIVPSSFRSLQVPLAATLVVTGILPASIRVRDSEARISLRAGHVLGTHELIEAGGGQVAEGERGFAQGRAVVVGLLGDLGGLVVPDLGRERGDEHERPAQVGVDLLAV